MSRSYKRSHGAYFGTFRFPKGRKRAILNKARRGAIPPTAWDDSYKTNDCYMIWNLVDTMFWDLCMTQKEVCDKLYKKYKIPRYIVIKVIDSVMKRRDWKPKNKYR